MWVERWVLELLTSQQCGLLDGVVVRFWMAVCGDDCGLRLRCERVIRVVVKMDDSNITIEEYIRLEEEKARRRGKVYNWETATYGKIWYDEDVHDLRSVETEFPVIVFNDTLMSEPTLSSLNDETDFRISFDDFKDEDYTISDKDNDDDKIDIKQPSRVDTAYSLNEYSVYDTGINTAYPGVWIRRIDFLYNFRTSLKEKKSTMLVENIRSGNFEVLES
ncbi:hypothetical protein Tco_1555837 [Tanacetum coccineum]